MIEFILFDLAEVSIDGIKSVYGKIAELIGVEAQHVSDCMHGDKLHAIMKGDISETEYWQLVIQEGCYSQPADVFKKAVRDNFREIPGTVDVIRRLKVAGFGLGLLSDHAVEWSKHIEETHCFMALYDQRCYSFQCGYEKSSVESFHFALNKCGFDPERTLFIDDRQKNLDVAQKAGIRYVHRFTNARDLEKALNYLGIRI